MRIIANEAGAQNSNIVIAYKPIADTFQRGSWRHTFHVRIPGGAENQGQNAPTFTMQNTRFTNGAGSPTETFEAGFSYTLSPFEPSFQKWRIWHGGASGWQPLGSGPVLERDKWYRITWVVDFTTFRYRSLVIEAPDDPLFPTYRMLLDHPFPSAAKGFGAESFVVSVEAENLFVDFNANPNAAPTQLSLHVDDVTVDEVGKK